MHVIPLSFTSALSRRGTQKIVHIYWTHTYWNSICTFEWHRADAAYQFVDISKTYWIFYAARSMSSYIMVKYWWHFQTIYFSHSAYHGRSATSRWVNILWSRIRLIEGIYPKAICIWLFFVLCTVHKSSKIHTQANINLIFSQYFPHICEHEKFLYFLAYQMLHTTFRPYSLVMNVCVCVYTCIS